MAMKQKCLHQMSQFQGHLHSTLVQRNPSIMFLVLLPALPWETNGFQSH